MSTLLQSSDLSSSYPSAYRTKILDDVTKSRLDGDPLSESWSLTSSIIKAQSLACNSSDLMTSNKTVDILTEDNNKLSQIASDSPPALAQLTPPVSGDLHSLAWLQKNCILDIAPLDEEEAASGLVQANEIEVTTANESASFGNSITGNAGSEVSQANHGNNLLASTDSGFNYSSSYSGSIPWKKRSSFSHQDGYALSSNMSASFSSSSGARSLSQYSSSMKQNSYSDDYHSSKTSVTPPACGSLNSSMSSLHFDDSGLQKNLCHPLIYNSGLPSQQISSLSSSNSGVLHVNSNSSNLNTTAMATAGRRPPKPAYSYTHLIFMAIESTFHKCMTVNEIYNWCEANFPYFKSAGAGWKNSLRHNLSINKCFKRIPRDGRGPGRGAYWTVEPKERTQLLEAVKRNPWTLNTSQNAAFAFPGHYQYRSGPTVLSTNLHRVPYQMLDTQHQQHQAYSLFTGYSPQSPATTAELPSSSLLVVRNTDPDSTSTDNDATVVEEQQYAMLLKSLEDQAGSTRDEPAVPSTRVDSDNKFSFSKGHHSDADNDTRATAIDEMPLVHKAMRKMLLNKRKCPSDEECDSQSMTERDMQGVMDLFNLQNRASSHSGDRSSVRNQEFCDECKENQQAGCEACLARNNSSPNSAASKRTFFVTPAPMMDHEYARFQSVLRPRMSSLEDGTYFRMDENHHLLTSPEYSAVPQVNKYSSYYSKDKDRKRRKYNKRKGNCENHVESYPSSDEQQDRIKDEPLQKVPRKRGRPSNKEIAANQLKKKNYTKKSEIYELKRLKKTKQVNKELHKNKLTSDKSSNRSAKTKLHVSSKFLKSKIYKSTTKSNSIKAKLPDPVSDHADSEEEQPDNPVETKSEFSDMKEELVEDSFDTKSKLDEDQLLHVETNLYERDSSTVNTAAQLLLEISKLKLKRFQQQSGYWTSDSSPERSPTHT